MSDVARKCYFLISIAGEKPRKVVFELASDIVPKTCQNFASFCSSKDSKKTYRNTLIHRVIPTFMIQGGDYESGDGLGGEAFEGGKLFDESFELKHDSAGVLSMANSGKNSGGSQFFITLDKTPHLDGKHVVFGKVIEGLDVVKDIAKVETGENDRPISLQKVKIVDCGSGDGNIKDSDSSGSESIKRREKKLKKKHSKKKRSRKYSDDYDSESSYERKRDRKDKKKRKKKSSRRRDDDSYSDDDSSIDSREHRRHKKDKKKRYYSDDSSLEDSHRHRKKKSHKKDRKHRNKRSRKYSEDSYSSDDSRYNRKSKKSQKKRSRKESTQTSSSTNSFGKYGIVRDSDFLNSAKVKRSFEIWIQEVKGIPLGSNLARHELEEYRKTFAEDYNTATLPHEKYYDYDKWEMEEYQKQKEESKKKKGARSDEFEFQEEMKRKAEEKKRKELELTRMMMSKDKIEEMKHQARIKAEMVNAYRVGDEDTRKKLQRRLNPDENFN